MHFTFRDTNATYESQNNKTVTVKVGSEQQPTITATGFFTAKQAVEMRLAAQRKADMDKAWAQRRQA